MSGEHLAKQIAEALEVRANGYSADSLAMMRSRDVLVTHSDRRTVVDKSCELGRVAVECRELARLLRTNELPGVDWEDHL